jgi:hypothetical protein
VPERTVNTSVPGLYRQVGHPVRKPRQHVGLGTGWVVNELQRDAADTEEQHAHAAHFSVERQPQTELVAIERDGLV